MDVPKDSWKIDPRHTALVVLDMQRAFLEKGAPREMPDARRVLPGVNKLADICRSLKAPVIFIREAFRPDLSDMGLMKEIRPAHIESEWEPIEGTVGADFYPGLHITKDDYIVTKIRYSAFIAGSSSLEPLLRGLDCDSIIICGCCTEVCANTTAADATQLGFRVFFVSDLTARISKDERDYLAILYFINRHYAKVMTLAEIKKELGQ